jgi:predicted GNAT family N-acyltransferase
MSVHALREPPAPGFPELTVRFAETDADMSAVIEIRRRVFGHEQAIAGSSVVDAADNRSLHALAIIPGGAVGTGRLTLNAGQDGEAHIAWVATLTGYRGQGIGRAVMRLLLDAADDAGAPVVVLAAQVHALSFYRRLGFVPFGRRYLVSGIEHQLMARAGR